MKLCYIINFVKDGESKVYVGQTKCFEKRIKVHMQALKNNTHKNINLQRLFNEGWEYDGKPTFYILSDTDDPRLVEKQLILEYLEKGLAVNIEVYGDTFTLHPERALRVEKHREGTINRFRSMTPEERSIFSKLVSGKNNGMYGKKHSQKTRSLISEKLNLYYLKNEGWGKGKNLSPEHRVKISEHAKKRTGDKNPFFGKHHSEETRRTLSIKNKGKLPPSTKKVSCQGKLYVSCAAAAIALNVSTSLISWKARNKSEKYSDYFFVV